MSIGCLLNFIHLIHQLDITNSVLVKVHLRLDNFAHLYVVSLE